jgi:hypothetical protein
MYITQEKSLRTRNNPEGGNSYRNTEHGEPGDKMNTATSKTRCPTIAEIARHNEQAGGHYFDPGTLRFFGQTLGDFKAKRIGGRVED